MKKILISLLAASLFLMFSGCASSTRNMATVRDSVEATGVFFDGDVSDYTFYTCGPDAEPIALLALKKDYVLHSDFWHKILKMDAAMWTNLPKNNIFRRGTEYLGKEIVSPQSETIGFIISRHHWVTAWFDEPGSTEIIIPQPQRTPQQPDPNMFGRKKS